MSSFMDGELVETNHKCSVLPLNHSIALWSVFNGKNSTLESGNNSPYTATMYFSYTILANPELEPHAPNNNVLRCILAYN